jgi:hypothetical protein
MLGAMAALSFPAPVPKREEPIIEDAPPKPDPFPQSWRDDDREIAIMKTSDYSDRYKSSLWDHPGFAQWAGSLSSSQRRCFPSRNKNRPSAEKRARALKRKNTKRNRRK